MIVLCHLKHELLMLFHLGLVVLLDGVHDLDRIRLLTFINLFYLPVLPVHQPPPALHLFAHLLQLGWNFLLQILVDVSYYIIIGSTLHLKVSLQLSESLLEPVNDNGRLLVLC